MVGKIVDIVSVKDIEFSTNLHAKRESLVVTYAQSTGLIFFNLKMTEKLGIIDWDHALVGLDKSSGVIVLKKCDAEEYGSVMFRPGYGINNPSSKTRQRAAKGKTIYIKHMIKGTGINVTKRNRAERNGNMVFIEGLPTN